MGATAPTRPSNQFVLEVRPAHVDANKLVAGPGYNGQRLSLNFQNVEIRALLQGLR